MVNQVVHPHDWSCLGFHLDPVPKLHIDRRFQFQIWNLEAS